jgi:SSS family solute:Na+ symporter
MTPAPRAESVRFTWYGATLAERATTRASWNSVDVVLSLIVLVAVMLIYAAFW